MQTALKIFTAVSALTLVLGGFSLMPASASASAEEAANAKEAPKSVKEEGKELAFNRQKGNCLACHKIDDGESPGNIGPALVGVQARFPDKAKLRAQIYDSISNNPNSLMPPFGKHGILTAEEIDKIVEYIHSL